MNLLKQSSMGWNDPWRYLAGILIVFFCYFIGQLPLYGLMYWRLRTDNTLGSEALGQFEETMNFSSLGIDKNLGFLFLILMFVIAIAGLYFVIRVLHGKHPLFLISPNGRIDVSKILFGFGLWFVLGVILEAINYAIAPETYTFRWQPVDFILLVGISLFLLPVQTTFEELFFRGYLMQGIAYHSRKIWVPVVVSSVLFGLVHGTNPEVAKYGFFTMQFYYILAGLFLAVITILDDGLELALGVHAATNIAGATLVTYQGSVLQTDSLFSTTEVKPWAMILGFILVSTIFITVCYKKYAWPPVSVLLEDIETPDQENITG